MGNCASSTFMRPAIVLMAEPLEKGSATKSECISADGVFTTPMRFTIGGWSLHGLGVSSTTVVDAATGALLYTSKEARGLNSLTVTVTDQTGALVCVAKGKRGLRTGSFKVLTPAPSFVGQQPSEVLGAKATKAQPTKTGAALLAKDDVALYERAEGKVKLWPTTASCEYRVLRKGANGAPPTFAPLYHAKKPRSLGFLLRVEGPDGALLGKVAHLGMCPCKIALEAGMGVDVVACLLMSAFVGAASGSGGAPVGGLAGAGVI